MELNALLLAAGATSFFTSRAFLPAFLLAISMRYGADIPLLSHLGLFKTIGGNSSILTHDYVIVGLGILSIIEVLADKVPEAQEIISLVDKYLKPTMAFLTTSGILNSEDAQVIQKAVSQAGFAEYIPAACVGACVYYFSQIRSGLHTILIESDQDDDLGIRRLISWSEDFWASFGLLTLLIFPLLMTLIVGLSLGTLFLINIYLKKREEKLKIDCPHCNEKIYASALTCPKCSKENPNPKDIGWLGQTINEAVHNKSAHAFKLAEKRRCKKCASRLPKRSLDQECPECQTKQFEDEKFYLGYVDRVSSRLPKVLLMGAGMSLIPVAGLIAGILYYRINLVGPFQCYISNSKNIFLKIFIRIFFFILLGIQIIPIAGVITIPIMALVNYKMYRGSFVRN